MFDENTKQNVCNICLFAEGEGDNKKICGFEHVQAPGYDELMTLLPEDADLHICDNCLMLLREMITKPKKCDSGCCCAA